MYVSLSGKDTRQVAAPMASVVRPSLAAYILGFPHSPVLFLNFHDTRQNPPRVISVRQRLTFSTGHCHPGQVSAPFAP